MGLVSLRKRVVLSRWMSMRPSRVVSAEPNINARGLLRRTCNQPKVGERFAHMIPSALKDAAVSL